jgi:signal transduction histidine kinase
MIQGDESQLSQVLMNIILNAVDAMPKGGILSIHTEECRVEGPMGDLFPQIYSPRRKNDPAASDYSRLRKADSLLTIFTTFAQGDHLVRIRVSDTGVGISKGDIERIFDPFFTTKSPDKGTGLGLSVSLRIIESLGGEIKVQSEVGRGSTFDIYFPVVGQGT